MCPATGHRPPGPGICFRALASIAAAIAALGCSAASPRTRDASPPVADAAVDASDLYVELQDVIVTRCAFARCHGGTIVGAGLAFPADGNFRDALVGVPACEYDLMKRVEPYEPDRSWLMVKLTADVHDTPERSGWIEFTPDEDWVPPSGPCGLVDDEGTAWFGLRMPATAPNKLSDEDIDKFRRWIELGAPGP